MFGLVNNKWVVSHIRFSLLFTVGVFVVCNGVNWDRLVGWFVVGGALDVWGLLAYLVLGYCLFLAVFLLFVHPWVWRGVAGFFLVSSVVVTYFIDVYGIAFDRSMLMNTLYTDQTEVGSLLSVSMVPYGVVLGVGLVLLFLVRVSFQSLGRYLLGSVLLFVLALGVGISAGYLKFGSLHRAGNISDKYIVHGLVPVNIINSIGGVAVFEAKAYLRGRRVPVEIVGRVSRVEDLVVVLAIGETARQKNFSLYGYGGNVTNPLLAEVSGLHVLNGRARLGSTLLALEEMLARDGVKLAAITSGLGIPTGCFVNFSLYENCDAVGEVWVSDCGHGGRCFDEDVGPLLGGALEEYGGGFQLSVLHLGGGSHGPVYRDRHPAEFRVFAPECLDADVVSKCSRNELYNSYDNSVLYTDFVVEGLIGQLEDSGLPYVFIYMSDHGESLGEGGRVFHGMPPGVALPEEQAAVPLLLKASVPVVVEERGEYSQQDVFDSVLSLLSIETEWLQPDGVFIRRGVGDE